MGVALKFRWKQIINQLRYLYEEYDVVQTISRECAVEFQLYYEEYCARNNIDINKLTQQNAQRVADLFDTPADETDEDSEPVDIPYGSLVIRDKTLPDIEQDMKGQMSQEERAIHDSFRKVFLKLALLLHPDKIDPSLSPEAKKNAAAKFQKIKTAFEEKRYFILLDYAEQYNIAVPKNYKQQIKWMKREVFQIQEQVDKEKVTYNYAFAECDSDENRDLLIEKFLRQVFGADFAEKS